MLSISNITSKHATNYYSNGDYYTKDNNTKIIGEWYGKIAERLNLNNKPFEKTDFENILNLNGRTKKIENGKLKIENYKELKTVDSGKLIVDSYNKLKIENGKLIEIENGELKIENYNKLKTGSLNNGINNNTNNNNNKPRAKRACGIDLTFSAPKSVSIVCELQDKAIAKIHQNAVKNTLSYIEDNFIFTRTQKAYKQEHNILATLFLHNTSRELDPQLHTHCILHNMVLDENNDSSKNNNNNNNNDKVRSAYFKDIFNNKKFLGSIYRNELAKGLIKAGYEIEFQDNKFNFEIKGVSPELIKTFSTRRQQIEAKLKESISTVINGKISAKATLLTRKAKEKQINEMLLKKLWEDKAKDFDLSHLKNNKAIDVNNNVNNYISKDNDINRGRDINKDNNIINNNTINNNQNKDINNNNNSNIKTNIKDNINNNIKQAIVEATVQEYLKLDKQQREQTLILAPANETRTAINNLLREKLRKEYELDKSYNKELENNHNNNNTIYSMNNNNSNSNNNKLQKQTIFERIKNLFTNKELTDITINTLQQKPLTELEKKDIKNYSINDKLIFNRDFENYNIKKQKEYNIIGIDNKTNSLLITSDISNSNNNCNYNKDINNSNDNKDISNNSKDINNNNTNTNINTNTNNRRNEIKLDIDKAKDFDVFETKQLPLQKYEELKWTRTIKEQDIFKHTELQLVKITEKYLVFKNKEDINLNKDRNKNKTKNNNNKEIILKYNNPLLKYLDYNYTTTTYSAQGRTSNNVIVALESYRTNLTNQKSFYVELSRARENITIITDDKDKLLNQLIKNTGEKTNAMDILDKERTTESVKDRMTLEIENGKLKMENYDKLKTDSLNISENNKVKTTNDLNIKINGNLNNNKNIESKSIKKDMGFEMEM